MTVKTSGLVAGCLGTEATPAVLPNRNRAPPHAYRGTFRIGEAGAVDGTEDTDGLEIVSAPLGPRYPMGLLVVQDGVNLAPDGAEVNQNFKLVSWQDVLDALDRDSVEGQRGATGARRSTSPLVRVPEARPYAPNCRR